MHGVDDVVSLVMTDLLKEMLESWSAQQCILSWTRRSCTMGYCQLELDITGCTGEIANVGVEYELSYAMFGVWFGVNVDVWC